MTHSITERAAWLATSHLLGLNQKCLSWFKHRHELCSLFEASVQELGEAGFSAADIEKIQKLSWKRIKEEEQWYEKRGTILPFSDPRYPPLLKEIADPPLVLYIVGEVELLSLPQLAIVGSRHPSPLGREKAKQFAKAMVEAGFIITSGLALGIDGACHEGALISGGKTLAVMGTGINKLYPRSHERLAKQIQGQGALISEFPLNSMPAPWHFPRRNRIISGLSLGVLVVEAAPQSGSLITARLAVEQNREVFAIPGSINHPLAKGCHQLIREGAKLVEVAADILSEFSFFSSPVKKETKRPPENFSMPCLEDKQSMVLSYVDYSVTPFDLIRWQSGLTASEVSSILLSLELEGYIQACSGGYIRCQ